jgi:1-acyl-sn-glycerol-3-phosphate acyltransferase
MLPEGRINITPELLLPGHSGAVLVALKARVPVIPCYIAGAPYGGVIMPNLIRPARVRLVIGRPMDLSAWYDCERDRKVLQTLTMRVMREIARLGGHSGYQPRVAADRGASRPGRDQVDAGKGADAPNDRTGTSNDRAGDGIVPCSGLQ